jgi:hypothetical protein
MPATTIAVEYAPHHVGPVWDRNPDGSWRLPPRNRTLGWGIIRWCADNLLNLQDGGHWSFTPEQMRFVLWFYAIDDEGNWIYRDGALQRMKGWGKDPLAAVLSIVEFVGPCRFDYFDADGMPVAKDERNAWVQIAAVALGQTANTAALFPALISQECIARYDIELNKERSFAKGGIKKLEVIASSSRTLEGGRPTFVVRNETHHWMKGNGGYDQDNPAVGLSAVIMRNLGKNPAGLARGLSITNAYNPSEISYGRVQREEYLNILDKGGVSDTLYDSLEAPPGTTIVPPFTRWDAELGLGIIEYDDLGDPILADINEVRAHLTRLLTGIRGDATWLNIPRLIADILSGEMSLEEAKRFYLNSVVLGDDASFDPEDIRAMIREDVAASRRGWEGDPLRVGWKPVSTEDEVVLFGDGSKSDDATGLVGCRLSDGYVFTVGVWQKPKQGRVRAWTAPRDEVDGRVREAMIRFNVVSFWFDPSHAKDDEDQSRYWDVLVDAWHQEFGDKMIAWAQQSGDRRSAVGWDMTSPQRQIDFVGAVERFTDEVDSHLFEHDGHPALIEHLVNCRRRMTTAGLSVGKISRSSPKKIDLGVCAIGARMLRRVVMNKGPDEKKEEPGVFWGGSRSR